MDIFIISLAEATERRARITKILSEANLNYTIFDAVNGHKGLPSPLVDLPDDHFRKVFKSRPLSSGERGCYASHYLLWQKCIELDKPIVVLEDDAIPLDGFKKMIVDLEQLHDKYGYIRLETQSGSSSIVNSIKEEFNLVYWDCNDMRTGGYSISPAGAKAFLEASFRWCYSVDYFIGSSYIHKVPSVGIVPPIVSAPNDLGTHIQLDAKTKVHFLYKITRESYRFYRFWRMKAWNIMWKRKNTKAKGE
ncbi:glycosyltransferase family 25 protein [Vibrio penaeicida]|uniref:glycosyltransferase family 25 protein n=1 Tax=Vibrio penaeicida TaxID=104609 RepID=UPI002737268B|nr:glycosyltransferase family 25 protein [Vibrio penaeicida]MDP2573101.1 glycosyltransferase family 25 protein [Vibrio penaeicida]